MERMILWGDHRRQIGFHRDLGVQRREEGPPQIILWILVHRNYLSINHHEWIMKGTCATRLCLPGAPIRVVCWMPTIHGSVRVKEQQEVWRGPQTWSCPTLISGILEAALMYSRPTNQPATIKRSKTSLCGAEILVYVRTRYLQNPDSFCFSPSHHTMY